MNTSDLTKSVEPKNSEKVGRKLKTLRRQPCCGFFLQGGVKAVAIVDIGIQVAMITVLAVGIIVGQPVWHADSPDRHFARPFYWTFYFFYEVVNIILSVFLFKKANERDDIFLKRYLVFSILFVVPWLLIFISHSIWLHGLHAMVITTFAGVTVYKLYSFWVIKAFINEIAMYGGFNAALRELTDKDIEDFEKGHPAIPESEKVVGFQNRPYRKDFEIPIERLEIDERFLLGSGAFGIVYRGNLLPPLAATGLRNEGGTGRSSCSSDLKSDSGISNSDAECSSMDREIRQPDLRFSFSCGGVPVAVKTLEDSADITYFKALLSELKILSYIGQHENIVNLIGACTSKIRERKIYVVVEFCLYGNLLNYLRANRGLFKNLMRNGEIYVPQTETAITMEGPYTRYISDGACTLDLLKWSMQTARGMEYIASKKVIHGDLAARNVLLTEDKNVKIADFGLSRQLYNYSTYVKRNEEPLPWRWMSIESLSDLNFSSRSDVWSFGIVLWEYFTCAATPYPGFSYCGDFLKLLQNGLRPEQPQYSSDEIYTQMKRCWDQDPCCRPTFTELADFFEQLYNAHAFIPECKFKSS